MKSSNRIDLISINAIHDKDLRTILDNFGLAEKIDNNSLLCGFCYQPISWNDIGALLIKEGRIILCCKLLDCISSASYMMKDGRVT